jgi:hypothetical protein
VFLNCHFLYLDLNTCRRFWSQILLPVELRFFPFFFLEPHVISKYSILPCDDGDDDDDDDDKIK